VEGGRKEEGEEWKGRIGKGEVGEDEEKNARKEGRGGREHGKGGREEGTKDIFYKHKIYNWEKQMLEKNLHL
jgi:hypothetical protein